MSEVSKIYLVRHGQTTWNQERRLQGHQDSPLTEEGIEEAKQLAQLFSTISFAEVFSSDLLRAKRTAEIVALNQKLVVKTNQLLREKSFGKYEGKKVTEYREELKVLIEQMEKLETAQQLAFKLDAEIESDQEIVSRLVTFLKEVAAAYLGKNVLVVTHGAIMRAFLIYIGYADYKEMAYVSIKNLAYIIIETDGTNFLVNETHNVVKKPQVKLAWD